MLSNLALPIRAVQGVLAIIILGLTAYAANAWTRGAWSPSEVNFGVFCSVWTLLAVAYLVVAPMRFPSAAHKFAILAVEAVTMIFWFAGFIALAAMTGGWGCGSFGPCRAAIAAAVFGAIEWLLWVATTVMSVLHVMRSKGTGHDPNIEVGAV